MTGPTLRPCEVCGDYFAIPHPHRGRAARYCSNACRQRAYRQRIPPPPTAADEAVRVLKHAGIDPITAHAIAIELAAHQLLARRTTH